MRTQRATRKQHMRYSCFERRSSPSVSARRQMFINVSMGKPERLSPASFFPSVDDPATLVALSKSAVYLASASGVSDHSLAICE